MDITFSHAIFVAVFTAIFAYIRYLREQEHQRKTLLNSLFAELVNIMEHYTYAAYELPKNATDSFNLNIRLRWSKYGSLFSTKDVGKLGFLDALNVKELLQIELKIRNDDILLEEIIKMENTVTIEVLDKIRTRLERRAVDASILLKQIVTNRPELEGTLEKIKKDFPIHYI